VGRLQKRLFLAATKVTFWEQVVTMSHLKSSPTIDSPIKLPAQYYSIYTNADGRQDVALGSFVKLEGIPFLVSE
jgi:hypothetical protein